MAAITRSHDEKQFTSTVTAPSPPPAAAAALSDDNGVSNECKELLSSLPKERGWRTNHIFYLFQGYWCQPKQIQAILSFQTHFQALPTDLVLATIPKSGTTWLKALMFAIANRDRFPVSKASHPLLVSNPHDLVPFFEYNVYMGDDPVEYLSRLPCPRIFGTHIPYSALADSIKRSDCKIVYICRNPFDTFVSSWIYTNKIRPDEVPPLPMEEAFDMYCEGKIGYGPFWNHVLGYWYESRERPNKVMFLKYEDMKADLPSHLRKLAQHLGYPFSSEEEKWGVVEEVAELCSFEKMKNAEVNKSGKSIMNFENKGLFRKAQVGDWVNYLSASMEERLRKEMEVRFRGSGLSLFAMNKKRRKGRCVRVYQIPNVQLLLFSWLSFVLPDA